MANAVIERGVQSRTQTATGDSARLNLVYFLFWMNIFSSATITVLWWVDLIPGFGTSSNLQDFAETQVAKTIKTKYQSQIHVYLLWGLVF